jgi:hypothetical protein
MMAGNENKDSDAGSARQGVPDKGGDGSRNSNFPPASPESNVNPPGAPQSSHGSATEPIPGGKDGTSL